MRRYALRHAGNVFEYPAGKGKPAFLQPQPQHNGRGKLAKLLYCVLQNIACNSVPFCNGSRKKRCICSRIPLLLPFRIERMDERFEIVRSE